MDVLLSVLGILTVAIGIGISIGLHELGHFYPARKFGVFVGQFMVGFGPTLYSRKIGETEFGIKAIPLGGYVSLSGMYPTTPSTSRGFTWFRRLVQDARDASAETVTDESRAFFRLATWKRVVIMLGGPVMNLVIAAILYVLIFSGFGIMTASTTIAYVAECVKPVTATDQTCSSTDTPSPAAKAGITPGDVVVAIGGQPVSSWEAGTAIIRESANTRLVFDLERDGTAISVTVTPMPTERYDIDDSGNVVLDSNGEPAVVTVGYVGVGPESVRQQQSPLVALTALGGNVVDVGRIIIDLPNRMMQVWDAAFGNAERDVNGPVSVVGVGRIAGEVASIDGLDWASRISGLLGILASLNVALFVFNLVPLLPLDGGHIAIAAIDSVRNRIAKLRGKPQPAPLDTAKLVPVTIVATVILLSMSALLIYADIVKPITLGL
jgi:membrane-associated protease RseP (regulator of RpoE activity)